MICGDHVKGIYLDYSSPNVLFFVGYEGSVFITKWSVSGLYFFSPLFCMLFLCRGRSWTKPKCKYQIQSPGDGLHLLQDTKFLQSPFKGTLERKFPSFTKRSICRVICKVLPSKNLQLQGLCKCPIHGWVPGSFAGQSHTRNHGQCVFCVLKPSRNKVVLEQILKNLLRCWWGEDILVVSSGITHLWSGNYSSVCGHTWLDNLSVDGFFCSISIKIHQMEQSGFNACNCCTKCSVIGLTNEAEEQDQTPLKMNLSFHWRVQESLLQSISRESV